MNCGIGSNSTFKFFCALAIALCGHAGLTGCGNNDGDAIGPGSFEHTHAAVCAETIELTSPILINTRLENRCGGVDYIYGGYGPLEVRNNATLTIDPGVTIQFTDVDGWGGIKITDGATIKAEGTAGNRIRFIGLSQSGANSWDMIHLDRVKTDNVFVYCDFIGGGRGTVAANSPSVLQINGSRVSITHCIISGSRFHGMGLWRDFELTAFNNNIIENCGAEPVALRNAQLRMDKFDLTSDFANNAKPYIHIQLPGIVSENSILSETSVPYYFNERITDLHADLTINAGVTVYMPPVKPENNCPNLSNGASANVGRFRFNGTTEKPIIFTRLPGTNYHWAGIEFTSAVNHLINNSVFEYGGSGGAVYGPLSFIFDASATLRNVLIQNSDSYGLYAPTHHNVSISHCDVTFDNNHSGNVRWGDSIEPEIPTLPDADCRLRSLIITVHADQSKVYGGADPVFTYTSSDPTVTFTGVLNRDSGNDAGAYVINRGTLAPSNDFYYEITFVPAVFTITPRPITVTANPGQSKISGDPDPILTYTSSDSEASFTGALSRMPGEVVGTYQITQGTLTAGSNYNITFVGANFEILHEACAFATGCGVIIANNGGILQGVPRVGCHVPDVAPTVSLQIQMNDIVVSGGSAIVFVTSSHWLVSLFVQFDGESGYYEFAMSNANLVSQSASGFVYSQTIYFSQELTTGYKRANFRGITADCAISSTVSKNIEVRRVGSGNLQITLTWDNNDDLDLYVRTPGGAVIYYGNSSVGNGYLDMDANVGCGNVSNENIYFTGTLANGDYVVSVEQYHACRGGASYRVTASAGGQLFTFSHNQTGSFSSNTPNYTRHEIGVITVRNGVVVIPNLPAPAMGKRTAVHGVVVDNEYRPSK